MSKTAWRLPQGVRSSGRGTVGPPPLDRAAARKNPAGQKSQPTWLFPSDLGIYFEVLPFLDHGCNVLGLGLGLGLGLFG